MASRNKNISVAEAQQHIIEWIAKGDLSDDDNSSKSEDGIYLDCDTSESKRPRKS